MAKTQVLFGVRIGQPGYAEILLTDKPERIEAAKTWALANGFDRLRVATIDLATPPNFVAAIMADAGIEVQS